MKKKWIRDALLFGIQTKTWKIMRLNAIFLFLCLSQAWAISGYSQATKLTLKMSDSKIIEVIDEIEEQSEFYFLFNQKLVDVERKVDIDVQEKTIDFILQNLFAGTNVNHMVLDRQIVLTTFKQELLPQQQRNVSGTVTDESGQPLPGVTVIIKGTTQGTVTNIDGNYSLSNIPEDATLVFSFVGMRTQEIEVENQTTINVELKVDAIGIEEVVAVGFGTMKKINLTGAISSIKSDELSSVVTTDVTKNLAGKLPGLRVMQIGGEPGTYDNQIDIRGWGNMLVVIDGIPRDGFQQIDPNTIESMTILKDASAAVYGVKAANGVLLVTTKSGYEGKAKINANISYGFQHITDYPLPITNSIDNLILKNEAALVAGNPLPFPNWQLYTGEDPLYPSVDWWGLATRNLMPMIKNNFSINGGNDKVNYYISIGNLHEEGLYTTKSLYYDRYNLQSKLSVKISNRLTADINIRGMIDEKNSPYRESGDFFKQVWMQPTYEPVYANNTPPYYYDGQADRNPMALINPDVSGYRKSERKQFQSTISLTYDIPYVDGLQVKGLFAYDISNQPSKSFKEMYYEYKYHSNRDEYLPNAVNSPTTLLQDFEERIFSHSQLSLNYKKQFADGKHGVEALLLAEKRDGNGTYFSAQRYFAISVLDQLNAGLQTDQRASGSDLVLDANAALVGRINYDYKSKYLAEMSFRYDGSSLFPQNSRWGFFPAMSVGWRISEEPFIRENLTFMNNFKIRFSQGKMGDDSGALGFQFIPGYIYPSYIYSFDGATVASGAVSKGLANPNITWFTSEITNIGIDGLFWDGLFDFQLDIFRRKRDGLLSTRSEVLPTIFGADLPQENLNSDLSKGFEIVIGHNNKIKEFSYGVSANLSYAHDEWIHYEVALPGNSYVNWRNKNENRSKNIRWGYGYEGQFQSEEEINSYDVVQLANGHASLFPGDIKYEDWNEDGMINYLDEHPISRNVEPEIFYGLNFSSAWKGFSLNLFFQGATNFSQMPQSQLQGPLPWGRNSNEIFLDRWHHEDPLDFNTPWVAGKYPITRENSGFPPNKLVSKFWVKDVAYLRLKSISVFYELPRNLVRKVSAQQINIFASALNVLTWKNTGIIGDPERRLDQGADYDRYPLTSSFNFGIDITF